MKPFKPPAARATQLLAGLSIGVQLLTLLMGAGFDSTLTLNGGLVPARITGAVAPIPGALPPWLTLVTHQFLHAGLVHLAMNMVFLLWVGRQVEWIIGPGRLVTLYLLGGLAGGLLQVFMAPGSVVPVVGASGAVSAIFATYALLFARSSEAPGRLLGFALSGETIRALRYAALWIGLQLLTAVALNIPGSGGIAVWAHIGGFVAGLLFGLPWVRDRASR
jgi:membrane associated rhomboid family serine protease